MSTHSRSIQTIYKYGCYSEAGMHAIEELADGGGSALDLFLLSQHDPPQSELHIRDLLNRTSTESE